MILSLLLCRATALRRPKAEIPHFGNTRESNLQKIQQIPINTFNVPHKHSALFVSHSLPTEVETKVLAPMEAAHEHFRSVTVENTPHQTLGETAVEVEGTAQQVHSNGKIVREGYTAHEAKPMTLLVPPNMALVYTPSMACEKHMSWYYLLPDAHVVPLRMT